MKLFLYPLLAVVSLISMFVVKINLMSVIKIKGYHGTSVNSAELIVKSNYEKSIGDKEWLGDGVYFFIDGLSSKPN